MISCETATALVVLFPFLTCFPPRMKREAMEIRTVARRPRASVTSMRLKPLSSLSVGSVRSIHNVFVTCIDFLRRLGRHLAVGAGDPPDGVEVQRPAVGPGAVDGVLQGDGRGTGAHG